MPESTCRSRRRGPGAVSLAVLVLAGLVGCAGARAQSSSPAAAPATTPATTTHAAAPASPGARDPRPALVVLIVVDQLRADYIPHWDSQLTGGFARFYRQGTFFTDGRQDHAVTETAPGHATILSGRTPAHTGIVTNTLGVADPAAPLLEVKDLGDGASPRRFRGTTLYDWMRAADGSSRVLSVSRKDRGAILPVGRAKGDVYWYASGIFTTSSYYRSDTLPGWVREFNAEDPISKLAGSSWTLLLPDSAYSEPDSLPFENFGREIAFPHRLTPNGDAAVLQLPAFPVMDSLTLAFALRGVERLALGRRRATDLLVVSLSTMDAVGHAFGPDSRELHDEVLRVDHWLGWFLDSLAALVPRDRTLFALTGDHGMTSMPEYVTSVRHGTAGRVTLDDLAQQAATELGRRYGTRFDLGFEAGLLWADVGALRARGVPVDSVARALADSAAKRPGVGRVYTPAALRAAPPSDSDAVLWRRTLPDDFGWLICATTSDGYVWSPGLRPIAEHGTTHLDDQRVPIAFLGPGIPARRWSEPVSTTDIGPTLAALLGIHPTERLDGRVLTQVLPESAR
jgi:arylsulfatase A-like enzyme